MTKQNVVKTVGGEGMGIALAAMPNPSPLFPFPPPRAAVSGGKKKFLTQLELGTSCLLNAWVDSMKASSPTHAKAAVALAVAEEDAMALWNMKHPSALEMFDEITNISEGKQIVMFLDYDGTLSPIVDDPDGAIMSETMRTAVRNVARFFPTAIVSGRCRDKVYDFVGLRELYYAGSHGMDIEAPTQTSSYANANSKGCIFQPASEFLPMIGRVYKALIEKTKTVPGSKVENNKFCVSVHYRCVEEKKWSILAEQVRSVLKEYPNLRLCQGRKVLEIRPKIKWDKGKALEFLLESLGFANCSDVLPVYIGDDRSDEDAFKVLRERGQGVGIVVSKYPKETNALYSLQEPSEVMDFLNQLVEWKQVCSS